MRILSFNDVHATGRSPQSRVDVFPNAIKDKLTEIGDIANRENVDLILSSGDLFHTPVVSINYSSEIAKIIRGWNKDTYIVPGNHDEESYNASTLNNTMLGMFNSTGVVNLLTRENPLNFKFKNKSLLIEGQEYKLDIDKDPNSYNKSVSGDFNILIAHGMLQPKPILNSIDHIVIDQVPNPANITIVGHDHHGWANVVNSKGDIFINIGSVGRTDKLDTHEPSVLILDIDLDDNNEFKYSLDVIKLDSAKPHEEVFDTTKTIQQNYKDEFTNFISAIQTSEIATKQDRMEYINELVSDGTISEEIKNVCVSYTDNAKKQLNTANIIQYTKIKEEIYIKIVKLKNFLSHKESEIEFDKGFNVIIGGNSSGKTSILRAIQWVLYDTPTGTNFFRTGAKDCEVYIEFSNGTWIKKRKTKSTAEYIVFDGTIEKNFKGFGNKLPMDIVNCHQMPLVNLYKDKMTCLNYGDQLNGLFLVNNTQGEKAEALGKITGADIIDTAIDDVNKDLRGVSKDINRLTGDVESHKEIIKDLEEKINSETSLNNVLSQNIAKIESYENLLKKIEDYKTLYSNIESQRQSLNDVTTALTIKENYIKQLNTQLEVLNTSSFVYRNTEKCGKLHSNVLYIDKLTKHLNASLDTSISSSLIVKAVNYYKDLSKTYNKARLSVMCKKCLDILNGSIKEDYSNVVNSILNYKFYNEKVLSKEKQIKKSCVELKVPSEDYSKIINSLLKHKNIIDSMEFIKANIKTINKEEEKQNKNIYIVENEIDKIKQDLHENGICPMCNRKLDDNAIEYMIANGGF